QCWTLDPVGNWRGMREAVGGSSWTLVQARASNTVNEITNITESTGASWANPAYDPAGNMTTIPKPADPTATFAGTWDAWNRLVKLVNTSNSQTVSEYQYDANVRRIIKKLYVSGSLNETQHLY